MPKDSRTSSSTEGRSTSTTSASTSSSSSANPQSRSLNDRKRDHSSTSRSSSSIKSDPSPSIKSEPSSGSRSTASSMGKPSTTSSSLSTTSSRSHSVQPKSEPMPLVDYNGQCTSALSEEQDEAAKRDPFEDMATMRALCGNLVVKIGKIFDLKETNARETEFSSVKRSILMDMAQLKRLNRIDKFRFQKTRDDVTKRRQEVDDRKLQLDNMKYETTYLQKEADKCLQFQSRDEEIPLIPEAEFFATVTPDILKPSSMNDEHKVRVARLRWELKQRQELEEKRLRLERIKLQDEKEVSDIEECLAKIQPLCANVIKTTKPIKDELNISDTSILQHMNSRDLEIESICSTAVDLESGICTEEQVMRDMATYNATLSQLGQLAQMVHHLKSETRVDQATSAESLEIVKKKSLLELSQLKTIHKRSQLRIMLAEEACAKMKTRNDGLSEELNTLEYQVNHVLGTANKYLISSVPTITFDLVPLDEFYSKAPDYISRPLITKHDEHELCMARLQWELCERRRLKALLGTKQAMRQKLSTDLDEMRNKSARLELLTSGIIAAAKPAAEQLALVPPK